MSGLLSSLLRPAELLALVKYKLSKSAEDTHNWLTNAEPRSKSYRKCYKFLNETSRSFAAVIQTLDEDVRHAVCIFYLVLRALDTVEDDMSIPAIVKVPMLQNFYLNLNDPDWNFSESTEKDKAVLEEFPIISCEFRKLPSSFQEIISSICKKMGEGMAEHLETSISSIQHWDQYCHYVAGLVGIGLSQLFAASAVEDESLANEIEVSNSMGLFLQKTNIIRDYLEDVMDNRHFWPREVWLKYADHQADFKDPSKQQKAVNCLNELITNTLQHLPHCIQYLSTITNNSVFKFCAIPQVMAIATLERCYNNPELFKGVVKIRKGEAVKLILESTDIEHVKAVMTSYLAKILEKVTTSDPSADSTRKVIQQALSVCQSTTTTKFMENSQSLPLFMSIVLLLYGALSYYWTYFGSFRALLS